MNIINMFKFIVRINHLKQQDLEMIGIPTDLTGKAFQLLKSRQD